MLNQKETVHTQVVNRLYNNTTFLMNLMHKTIQIGPAGYLPRKIECLVFHPQFFFPRSFHHPWNFHSWIFHPQQTYHSSTKFCYILLGQVGWLGIKKPARMKNPEMKNKGRNECGEEALSTRKITPGELAFQKLDCYMLLIQYTLLLLYLYIEVTHKYSQLFLKTNVFLC